VAIKNLKDNLKRLKDADPVELAGQVNSWLQESGETLRLRIEDEVEKAVTKRGFVKKSEFAKLEARIAALEGKASISRKSSRAAKASKPKTGKSATSKSTSSKEKNVKAKQSGKGSAK